MDRICMPVTDHLTNDGKKLFIAGVMAGIVGGIFPNLLVAFIMKILELQTQPSWAVVLEFFIVLCGFLGTIYLLARAIDRLDQHN